MAESLFYCIAANQADLTGMTESNIASFQPTPPNEYTEGIEVGISGERRPIELGFPSARWTWDYPLTASQWGVLMAFVGTAASAEVYIRTRTNQILGTEYEYKNFVCIMRRPKGSPIAPFRFEDAEIEFIGLVEV